MDRNKPKLLVVLGAGSSIPCGMPSVGKIDELMSRWSKEWTPELSVDAESDVFNILWESSKRYYGTNRYGIRPNYERVLGEMTELASWLSPRPFGNPIAEAIKDGAPIDQLEWLRRPSDEYACRKFVLSQQTFLLEKLADHMRSISKALDSRSPAFCDYVKLFCELRDPFDLGIYNLNYDTVAGTAWPEAYCGFDNHGDFGPLSVSWRQEWGFVYHLHGSVHHCITGHPHRIGWQDDLDRKFKDRLDLAADMAQDFRPVPLTTIITGGFKLDQLLAEPNQTFYSTLVRHVHEADAILIAGYGFGDLHVNRVLRNRFEGPDRDDRPHPRVVILEKSCPGRYRTARLETHEFRSWELTHTFKTSFSDGSRWPSDDSRTVNEFIEGANFETDIKNRVRIWHGGFPEALSAVNKITKWLLRKL